MSERSDKIKQLAESFAEKYLAWQISLPTPFTFVAVLLSHAFALYGIYKLLT